MRLRWNICKALGKTIDDPMFTSMHPVQWLAYGYLIIKDKIEEEERWRDRLEYLARFWNNEAVEQIQASREQATELSRNDFDEVLQQQFGRSIRNVVPPGQKSIRQLGQDIIDRDI